MNKKDLGKIIFWIGAAYLMIGGWLSNWWIVPMYKHTSPEQIMQTIWAPGGVLFYIWVLAIPVGSMVAMLGMIIYADPRKWFKAIAAFIGLMFVVLIFPSMKYHIWAFGLIGGLSAVLFLGITWGWARYRAKLHGQEKTAADYLLIGIFFFFGAAWLICGVLGNPFHTNPGLYFPEKVLEGGSLPQMYAQGIKTGVFLVLGFFFNFLGFLKLAQIKK